MRVTTTGTLIAALLGLAACSSGGGPSGEPKNVNTFDDKHQRSLALYDRLEKLDLAPIDAIKNHGSATYQGHAAFGFGSVVDEYSEHFEYRDQLTKEESSQIDRDYVKRADVNGDIALTVDFADTSFKGKVDNLRSNLEESVQGSVNISNGKITEHRIRGDVSGLIHRGDEKFRVAGDIYGVFLGANAQAVGGDIVADLEGKESEEAVLGMFSAEIE